LQYYDREGVSFLPPEAMAALSVYLPDPDADPSGRHGRGVVLGPRS
jgi:hypothetical protein